MLPHLFLLETLSCKYLYFLFYIFYLTSHGTETVLTEVTNNSLCAKSKGHLFILFFILKHLLITLLLCGFVT